MIIGITGQTGSGKSVVCCELKNHGYVIIDADKIARETVNNADCLTALSKAFGKQILTSDGTLDRSALAKSAFCSREKTDLLNSITHPAIVKEMLKIADDTVSQGKIAVLDAPQLFESGLDKNCDIIFAICANDDVRRQRIMMRDGIEIDSANVRMKAGLSTQYYIDHNAVLIDNSGDSTPEQIAEKISKTIERMKTV